MPPLLTSPASISSSSSSSPLLLASRLRPTSSSHCHFLAPTTAAPGTSSRFAAMSWLGKLGLGGLQGGSLHALEASAALAQGPDEDRPAPGNEFAQFGAGCFWGVELAFQRVPRVTRTEVGYSQGAVHDLTYEDVCTGATGQNEVVRVQFDTAACKYDNLLDAFWARHDHTTPNRQRVAHGALASQVRTGGLPLILQQMALSTDPVHTMDQDREVLTVAVGATKMGTQTVPILAADAHQIRCHRHHLGRDTKHVARHLST